MVIIAVTGGIGSGKSTVSARLVHHGALLIDSDLLAREVVAPGSAGLQAITDHFGVEVIAPDGSLNRPAMAAIVFSDPTARAALNKITHPLVRRRFAEVVESAPPDAVVVNDIPLLNSLEAAAGFALVIGVGATAEVRMIRLIGRGLTADDARARMKAQISDDDRRLLADGWLDNNGSAAELLAQVDRLWVDRLAVMNANLVLERPAEPATKGGRPAAALAEARIRAAAAMAKISVVSVTAEDTNLRVKVAGLAAAADPEAVVLEAVTTEGDDPEMNNPVAVAPDEGGPDGAAMVAAMRRVGFLHTAAGTYCGADPVHSPTISFDSAR